MKPLLPKSDLAEPAWTSSEIINSLTSKSGLFIFVYSPQNRSLIAWSGNANEILGVQDAAIARDGNLFLRHVHPDDRFLLLTDLEEALNVGSDYRATYRWIRPDNNESRWLHCRGKLRRETEAEFFEGIIIDLSTEFTGQVGRIAGPDSISTLLAAFPTMVFTLDKDLRILRLNRPNNMQSFNFGDNGFMHDVFKIGRSFLACFADQNLKQYYEKELHKLLNAQQNYIHSRIAVHDSVYNIDVFPISEEHSIEGLLFIINDISETVKLERELASLHKSEGLRLLASGVSHNFNNSLQSIIGQAAAIKNHPENKQLVVEASQAIIDIVNRSSQLTSQLFVYEEASPHLLSLVDINLAAMAATQKIENLFSCGIKVSVAFGTPSPVEANQEKLVQAFSHILKNAMESTPSGGSINIRTYQVQIASDEIAGLQAGTYAKISISDSGSGMAGETKERCMDPFFTTKAKDERSGVSLTGSGLGLSQSYAIAREFGGIVTLDSQPNVGTNVSMFLPVASQVNSQPKSQQLFEVEPGIQPEILIIDDDLMVLQTAKQILESAGYFCAAAEDASRALTLMQKHSKFLRLVIVDAMMPGIDGATLLRKLKRIKSDLKAIGFSGASPEMTKRLSDTGVFQMLRKPVDPSVLKNAVISAINSLQAA